MRLASSLLIPVLSASNFVIGMGAFVVIGLLQPLAADLEITAARAGRVMTTYAIAYALLSPVLVSVTGGIGRRRVLTMAMGLFCASCAMAALAPSELVLQLSRVLAAAGAGLFTPIAAAVAAGLAMPDTRAKALSAVFLGMTLAQVLGIPAGSYIAYTYGWRMAFWVVVALALPCAALIWRIVPRGLAFQPVRLVDLGRIMANPRLMGAVAFTAVFISGGYVVNTYITPLLSDRMGWGRDGIALALLLYGGGAVGGNVLGGWMADRIGPRATLTVLCLAQIVILPMLSLLPLPGAVVMAVLVVWSIFGWSFMAPQQVRLIGLAPEAAPVLLALNAAALYVGAAVGSAIGGVVLAGPGLNGLGVTAAGVIALSLLVLRLARD